MSPPPPPRVLKDKHPLFGTGVPPGIKQRAAKDNQFWSVAHDLLPDEFYEGQSLKEYNTKTTKKKKTQQQQSVHLALINVKCSNGLTQRSRQVSTTITSQLLREHIRGGAASTNDATF